MNNPRPARRGTYADLAHEYYDPARHPTSANFRSASKTILRAWLRNSADAGMCDVGVGDSLLAEVMCERGVEDLSRLVLVDIVPGMLAHSTKWQAHGARTLIADAEDIPFEDQSFDVVVASLGDPYNTPRFWGQARRIVRKTGAVIFTTPSFEWASWFRDRNREPPDAAEFLLADGSKVLVPSIILPERDQISRIGASGLDVISIYHVLVAALGRRDNVSEKLDLPPEQPIVSGYLAVRSDH